MLSKIGTYKYRIESSFCDFTGKSSLSGLSFFIIHAATVHAEDRGFGYGNIVNSDYSWVLSRISFRISEFPKYGNEVVVNTWMEKIKSCFSHRCFNVSDSEGKKICDVRSVWAAIDIKTRRPADLARSFPDLLQYMDPSRNCDAGEPGHLPKLRFTEPAMKYVVRYGDIDINCHMNSIKYIEHVMNVFDLDRFRENRVKECEIVYLAEAHYGDALDIYVKETSPECFLIDMRRGEDSICRCKVLWEKCQN